MEGRQLFLRQLRYFKDGGKIIDYEDEEVAIPKLLLFDVPEDLQEAFLAYHREYIYDHGQVTCYDGVFFDEDDISRGIRKKVSYYYEPMVQFLRILYPGLRFSTRVEASRKDRSAVMVIAENRTENGLLTMPVLVLYETWKVWYSPFEHPGNPQEVYRELEAVYSRMDQQVQAALQISRAGAITGQVKEKLRELAESCVSQMGDVFYDPSEFGDERYGLDDNEEPGDESATDRLIRKVTDSVYEALVATYKLPQEYRNVFVKFSSPALDEDGPTFGPYPFVQLTYENLRVGPDGEDLAYLGDEGCWTLTGLAGEYKHKEYSDLQVSTTKTNPGNRKVKGVNKCHI